MKNNTAFIYSLVFTGLLLAGCGNTQKDQNEAQAVDQNPTTAVITEAYLTERNENDNVDSPAIWHGPSGQHWLIATAKSTDKLIVYNAEDGSVLQAVGGTGTEPGQMDRPNGVFVIDNLCLVVERDNHRIQVFTLPTFAPIGMFGADDLVKPYGIAVAKHGPSNYTLWITDNYETPDEQVPPDTELGERVHVFEMEIQSGEVLAIHTGAFGATEGPGVLKVVESIAVDPPTLLIADELETENNIKAYNTDGTFSGRLINGDIFKSQPEGIALYPTSDTDGYWIVTDQSHEENVFHVLDRNTFSKLGSFKGAVTLNTDGIWVTNVAFGPFSEGAFYAVHDDGNVACFDWATIREALRLQ